MMMGRNDGRTFLPKTQLGKWSVWLLIVALLLFLIFIALMVIGKQQLGDHLFDNLLVATPLMLAYFLSVISCVIGLVAQFGGIERSYLVSTVTTLALLATAIGIFKVIIPGVMSLS